MRKILLIAAIVIFTIGTFLGSCSAQAGTASGSAQVSACKLALKVLPAGNYTVQVVASNAPSRLFHAHADGN